MLVAKLVDREGEQLELAKQLFRNYAAELNEDLCFQNFEAELQQPLKKYGAPGGALFLFYNNEEIIGCGALQSITQANTLEIKRMYIVPQMRGKKFAPFILNHLVEHAKTMGATQLVLDTLERLVPAVKLYEKNGFKRTVPYYGNPLNQVVYMQKNI
jgi:putative acetyltransferase